MLPPKPELSLPRILRYTLLFYCNLTLKHFLRLRHQLLFLSQARLEPRGNLPRTRQDEPTNDLLTLISTHPHPCQTPLQYQTKWLLAQHFDRLPISTPSAAPSALPRALEES